VSRFHNALRRWAEIALLAIVGASATAIIAPWMMPIIRDRIIEPGLTIPTVVLVVLVSIRSAWKRPIAWLGLPHLPSYPPVWVAGLLGILLLATFWTFHPLAFTAVSGTEADRFMLNYEIHPFNTITWWCVILVLVLLAVAVWGFASFRRIAGLWKSGRTGAPRPEDREPAKSLPSRLTADFAALRNWLRSDDEIDDPAMDAFGHNQVAARIARRLIDYQATGDAGPTVALVGELGSGKSSIRNLVVRQLREDGLLEQTIAVVPISLWPFGSPEAAVRGILNKLTEALSGHVNAPSITGLPEQYVQLMEKSGGRWSLPAQLLRGPSTPDAVLEEFEKIATTIGLTVVLWVEDVERFAATEHLPGDERALRENERLGPIRSLLHLLDRQDHITVVLAANTLTPRFDMEKLARYVEYPPRFSTKSVGNVLDCFRAGCREMLDQHIDPVPPQSRRTFDELSPHEDALLLTSHDRPTTVRAAVGVLCRTPRRLKQSLRAALDVWEPLVGEIDFDDVLVMSVLKMTEPDVFALVEEHIDELREGPRNSEQSPQEGPFNEQLKNTLTGSHPRRSKSVDVILDFIFPLRHTTRGEDRLPERPQGLTVNRHVSYWNRYLSVPALTEQERDQPILKGIDQWETDGQGPLPRLVADEERWEAVETFSGMLSPARLNQLLRAVINDRITEDRAKWPKDEWDVRKPPGIVALWRIMRRNQFDEEGLESTLLESIQDATVSNLALADELLHYFGTRETDVSPLLSDEAIGALRRRFEEGLARLSEPSIVKSLRGAEPYVLVRCCWSLDRRRRDDYDGLPFTGWAEFSDKLLNAFEIEPDIMLPQILPFLTSRDDSAREPVFDEELARRLFDYDRLLYLLREHLRADAALHPHIVHLVKAISDGIGGR
jgi:hypothetical protein